MSISEGELRLWWFGHVQRGDSGQWTKNVEYGADRQEKKRKTTQDLWVELSRTCEGFT